jgi:hypothetical protein
MNEDPDLATDSYRSWRLALAAWREQCIRRGQILPETPEERQCASEGPVQPSQLHAVKEFARG